MPPDGLTARRWPWTEWLIALGIALACAGVFANALPNAFVLDDQFRVVENPGIRRFWPPRRHFVELRTMSTLDRITQYRPLLPLTLSVNYAVSGDSVVGYHLGNLALQIAASLLAFFLCVELLRHWSPAPRAPAPVLVIAGFSALLFAVHPLSGIAVNYISARDLLLMQVFFLAMLLAYARMRRLGETAARWAAAVVLLALSPLAKTNLVVAPLIFLAFDVILARAAWGDRRVWLRAGAAAAVVGGFFGLTQVAANAQWRSGERLWSHSVAYGGDAVAHLNLAMSIADRHDPRVRAELEQSLRLEPNYALAHVDLCVLQLELGEIATGLAHCEYAARIAPSWPQAQYWLAFAYRRLGRLREAAAASARAAELDPDNLRYPYEAARDAQAVHDWAASLRLADLVRQRDPDYQEIAFVHGVALQWSAGRRRRSTSTRSSCARIPSMRRRR